MTEILRNEEGKILGGPTLAEVEASIARVHSEPPGRNALICAALLIGTPLATAGHVVEQTAVLPLSQHSAAQLGTLVIPQLDGCMRERQVA